MVQVTEPLNHAEAFGRIAIACDDSEVTVTFVWKYNHLCNMQPCLVLTVQLPVVEASVKAAGHVVLTPLVSLDTPGKAAVQVVIFADPVSSR